MHDQAQISNTSGISKSQSGYKKVSVESNDWKKARSEKAKSQLHKIVDLFQSENIPKAIKEVTFPPFNVPSNRWSLSNRLIMFFSGTSDARGFNQWKDTGRHVKKGTKALYILAPTMYKCASCECGHRFRHQALKKIGRDSSSVQCPKCKAYLNANKIKTVVSGFRGVPVFRKEDTEGRELEYEKIKVPDLPLLDVAEKWGIDIKGVAFQGRLFGYYQSSNNKIVLASPEEKTFFHELSHASQDRIGLLRKERQNKFNEVTAEVSALVLAELVGRENPNTGATYNYIKEYIGTEDKAEIGKYLLKVLSDVEKIVNNIISAVTESSSQVLQAEKPVLVEA